MTLGPFLLQTKSIPRGRSDADDEDEAEGDYASRIRGSDDVTLPDNDDDLDADETTLSLECPPAHAFPRATCPSLDAPVIKGHIMLYRRVGIGEGFPHATGTVTYGPVLWL